MAKSPKDNLQEPKELPKELDNTKSGCLKERPVQEKDDKDLAKMALKQTVLQQKIQRRKNIQELGSLLLDTLKKYKNIIKDRPPASGRNESTPRTTAKETANKT